MDCQPSLILSSLVTAEKTQISCFHPYVTCSHLNQICPVSCVRVRVCVCLCVSVKGLDVSHGANHTVHYNHIDSCDSSVFYLFLLIISKQKCLTTLYKVFFFLLYELEDLSPSIYVTPFPIRMYSVRAAHLHLKSQTLIKYV